MLATGKGNTGSGAAGNGATCKLKVYEQALGQPGAQYALKSSAQREDNSNRRQRHHEGFQIVMPPFMLSDYGLAPVFREVHTAAPTVRGSGENAPSGGRDGSSYGEGISNQLGGHAGLLNYNSNN